MNRRSFFQRAVAALAGLLGLKAAPAIAAPVAAPVAASAACCWDGCGSTLNWDDPGNWVFGIIPRNGDHVFVYASDDRPLMLPPGMWLNSLTVRKGSVCIPFDPDILIVAGTPIKTPTK